MVRSKEAPKKKPKDPLLTPPSKPRGGFLLDEPGRPWNRGGAAMSPAPASVPNYMRGTSSSDAKVGRRGRPVASVSASASPARRMMAAAVSASASPARRMTAAAVSASASPARRRPAVRVLTKGKVLFPEEAPGSASASGLGRATCSSTMKDAKFPDALDLAPGATVAEGPAALRVCPYTYCSLNGHVHAPAVPLRSFLASRRRLIKTQQSMKLKGVSAFRKKSGEKTSGGSGGGGTKIAPLVDEEAVGDFFVEVYAGPRVSTDMSCSDMSLDEMDDTVRRMEFVVFDRCGAEEDGEKGKDHAVCDDGEPEPHLQEKHGAFRDSLSEHSEADTGSDFVEELPWMRYHGYEYDDSLDDEISEEQRMRGEESGGAKISAEQVEEQGTSGRSADDLIEDAAEEQEKNDAENISNLVCGKEIVADQGVACRAEAREEPDGRFEENILNKVCFGEASAEQGTAEEQLSEDVYKSEIHGQEVIGWADTILEESCRKETSADREANDDECSVQSDGESEATEEQVVEDEEGTPDDGSEMEISEDAISGYGCREDFSDEVTFRAVSAGGVSCFNSIDHQYVDIQKLPTDGLNQNDSTADDVYEQIQYGNTADGVSEQDGIPANAKKALGITTSKLEDASEETGIAQESSSVGISTHVSDGDQMEPMKDASEESGVYDDRNLHDNAEFITDDAEMGPEITICKLEDASKETDIDQQTVEDEDSAFVSGYNQDNLEINKCKSEDALKESTTQEADQSGSSANISFDAQDIVEDADCVCVGDGAQNDLEMSKHNLEDASKELTTAQEADQSDSSANVSSDAQNESELTTSELAVVGISDNTGNEYKPSTCKSEDVSEESIIVQEADHDDSSSCVGDGAHNESEVITCLSEGVQPESDVIQEDEDSTAGAVMKPDITTCESGGGSSKCSMPQETDEDVSNMGANDSSEKATTMPKFDACEDIHVAEETNQSFIEQILAEFTDAKEPSIDDICSAFSGMNLKGDVYFDPAESATCPRNKLIISRRRRTPEEEEYLRGFNPRAPNFLPLELDPDAEKVDLKHQMMEERKNAEEWMIDYALRRAVTNLAPARKKKVELLVQAFETVLPHDEDDKKSITPTRPVQACN